MNLFGLNITRSPHSPRPTPQSSAAPVTRSLTAEDLALLAGSDSSEAHGPILTNAYQQVVWVYRAVNVLPEQIANIPFLFSRGERGRENLITTGPLHDFYARPHPYINRFQYWELRIIWLMLRGESFRITMRSQERRHRHALRFTQHAPRITHQPICFGFWISDLCPLENRFVSIVG
jgi:phage portal protein BeeE